jgi:hypothetical protein
MSINHSFTKVAVAASLLLSLPVFVISGPINDRPVLASPNGVAPLRGDLSAAGFSFAGINYFHRFTKDDQHEYTPKGQEDLSDWKDMVTINFYRRAKDGETLAATANAVLQNYKANKGMVVKTDSVPRTKDRPAEHLIVALFPRPEFVEVAFARFKMHEGTGAAVIYSHRIYGKAVGNEMSAWLEKNGPDTERNLMKWDAMPKAPSPR